MDWVHITPKLVTTRQSTLGPPAEGRPGPSDDDDDDDDDSDAERMLPRQREAWHADRSLRLDWNSLEGDDHGIVLEIVIIFYKAIITCLIVKFDWILTFCFCFLLSTRIRVNSTLRRSFVEHMTMMNIILVIPQHNFYYFCQNPTIVGFWLVGKCWLAIRVIFMMMPWRW